jgi:hypothetical protein
MIARVFGQAPPRVVVAAVLTMAGQPLIRRAFVWTGMAYVWTGWPNGSGEIDGTHVGLQHVGPRLAVGAVIQKGKYPDYR